MEKYTLFEGKNYSLISKFFIVITMVILLIMPNGLIYSFRLNLFMNNQSTTEDWNNTDLTPDYINGIVLWCLDVEKEIYSSPALADIDQDGSIDIIVCAGYFDEKGSIYCLERNGSIKWQQEFDKHIFSSPAIADLDKDGNLDIVFTCHDNYTYCLDHEGNEKWRYDMEGRSRSTPCIADLDGDGELEILIANLMEKSGYYGKLCCLNYNGIEKWANYTDTGYYANPTVADLDGDGKLEILIGSLMWDRFHCFNYDGTWNWTFDTEPSTAFNLWSVCNSAVVADIDNDLELEIVFGDLSNITYCLNATGYEEWRYYYEGTMFISSPSLADIDKDGFLEIIMAGSQGYLGFIVSINHDGSEQWSWRKDNLNWMATTPIIADLNNDNNYEIIFSANDNKTRIINGYGGYLPEWEMITQDLTGLLAPSVFSTAAVADLNNDGLLEIVFGTDYTGAGKIWCISFSGFSSSGIAPYPTYRGSNFRTGSMDSDFDFIDDLTERYYFGTLEFNSDSDGDGLIDGKELWYNTDPLDCDSDDDGYTDGEEIECGKDPNSAASYPSPDTDNDGLTDEQEIALGTRLMDADSDDDGLTDGDEYYIYTTDPILFDSDNDTLGDGAEVDIHETDPLDPDSDADGMPDGWEITYGLDPKSDDGGGDADLDGLTNVLEYNYGSNPLKVDTDGDTIPDKEEVDKGFDPADANSHPFLWGLSWTLFSISSGIIGFGATLFGIAKGLQTRRKKNLKEEQAQERLKNLQKELDEPEEWGIEDSE